MAPTGSTAASTETTTATQPALLTLELFYLAGDRKLVAERGEVPKTQAVASASLHELATAPAGTTTDVPDGLSVSIEDGDAHVIGAPLSAAALGQIVYTLTEFPTVKTVNGQTRQDVEDSGVAPAILVEQPLPGETVTSPLRVTGNADTFEATFEYELLGAAGTVLKHDFVTATSGSGTRGTFEFAVPFDVRQPEHGTLVVFESSAEDGSRIHERRIRLSLAP